MSEPTYPGDEWAVIRAAEWLDAEYPGWTARVRLRLLDMSRPYDDDRHLCGQLAGYREGGQETAKELWDMIVGHVGSYSAVAPSPSQELAAEIAEADQRDTLYLRYGDDSRRWPDVPLPPDGCTRLWRDAVVRRRANQPKETAR